MEFTEAESNMNDLVSEYQQYQVRHWGHSSCDTCSGEGQGRCGRHEVRPAGRQGAPARPPALLLLATPAPPPPHPLRFVALLQDAPVEEEGEGYEDEA